MPSEEDDEVFRHEVKQGPAGLAQYDQRHAEARERLDDAHGRRHLFAVFVCEPVEDGVRAQMVAAGEADDAQSFLFAASVMEAGAAMVEAAGHDSVALLGWWRENRPS